MDPDPDPNPDPTPFFLDFKNTKKNFLSYFFLTCPQAHHLQSKKFNFLQKFCVKILFCSHYSSPLNTYLRKGKDPDPYLWLMNPGGPKIYGTGSGSFPNTAFYVGKIVKFVVVQNLSWILKAWIQARLSQWTCRHVIILIKCQNLPFCFWYKSQSRVSNFVRLFGQRSSLDLSCHIFVTMF